MPDETKDTIADAFKRYFEHFGFKKTSVDAIAHELKISKKTIYQHFNTKEEIFYYLVSRVARQYSKRMAADIESLPTCQEKLARLVRLIFAETRQWVKTNDVFEFRYKYEIATLAFQDAYNELIGQLIRVGIEAGEFQPVTVDVTVRFINGIFAESMRLLHADKERPVEEEVIQAMEKLLS